jgi:hypothetical protein
MFLADSSPVADKESNFRQSISDKNSWFVEFIIGESHLKNGSRKEAFETFKRSYEAFGQSSQGEKSGADSWILEQLEKRLEDLSSPDKSAEADMKTKAGN